MYDNISMGWIMNIMMLPIEWHGWYRWPLFLVVMLTVLMIIWRAKNDYARVLAARGKRFIFMVQNYSLLRVIIKSILLSLGGLLIAVALLRPVARTKEQILTQKGRDLYIALDISRSMLAQDCQPNRLECAKRKIRELVQLLDAERVALVLFSGSAFVHCPLTSDYGAFFTFLDAVDVEMIASGTTALDKAIIATLESMKSSQKRNHTLLALFTDGENFSPSFDQLKERVRAEHLILFTFGIGSVDGAPIPLYDDRGGLIGYQKDSKGKVVITRCNQQFLAQLAEATNGFAIHLTDDNRDIISFKNALQKFDKEIIEEKKVIDWEDYYHYPLMGALLCLGIEWLL